MSSRFVHDRWHGYMYISNNSAERVHLYPTRDGTQRWSANRAHPTVRTLSSYGPILHPTLKVTPLVEGIVLELWNAPVWPHGRRTERVVSLPPLPHWYPLSCWQVWVLSELNSALTPLSARWCVRKSYWQVDPLAFRPGQAHVLHP
jgi:hypothetical protein